jgi:fumarate reductase subunit D
MDRDARGAGRLRMRQHSSYWAFVVHRVSGIALAAFLPLHFWTLGTALQLDAFLAWTQQPLVKLGEWLIVVALAAHLGGGLRVLALEFLAWRDWQKNLTAAAAAITIAVGLAFALAL